MRSSTYKLGKIIEWQERARVAYRMLEWSRANGRTKSVKDWQEYAARCSSIARCLLTGVCDS